MANVNTVTMSDSIKTFYEKRLLTRAIPRYVHGRWGKLATINKFGSYELRAYGALTAISAALGEGVTPAENTQPSLTLTTITPLFYGSWLGWTDTIEMQTIDPLLTEFASILGEQAGLSADTLVRATLIAGATADYSGTATSLATLDAPSMYISYADFLKQLAALQAANALPLEGPDYVCIIHPDTWATLMLDPVFVNLFSRETGDSALRSGYMGRILNCRLYVTSNAYELADQGVDSLTDVYGMLMIGKEAHGYVGFGNLTPDMMDGGGDGYSNNTGKSVKPVSIITKQLGSAGADDPLDQRATMGWKMAFATSVLNANWIRNLYHVTIASDD